MKKNPDFSQSKREDWETPKDLFDSLNEEFGFTINEPLPLYKTLPLQG